MVQSGFSQTNKKIKKKKENGSKYRVAAQLKTCQGSTHHKHHQTTLIQFSELTIDCDCLQTYAAVYAEPPERGGGGGEGEPDALREPRHDARTQHVLAE